MTIIVLESDRGSVFLTLYHYFGILKLCIHDSIITLEPKALYSWLYHCFGVWCSVFMTISLLWNLKLCIHDYHCFGVWCSVFMILSSLWNLKLCIHDYHCFGVWGSVFMTLSLLWNLKLCIQDSIIVWSLRLCIHDSLSLLWNLKLCIHGCIIVLESDALYSWLHHYFGT